MELEVKNKGFTIIELLVTMVVFGLVMIAMTGMAQFVIKGQRKAFALQEVQENGRYILESMSKEIRMSTIDSASSNQTSILNITNSAGELIDYQFTANKIRRRVNSGAWQDISPSSLNLTGWFYIRKGIAPAQRALITTTMKIESAGARTEEQTNIYLQSTISSRNF